MIRLREILVIVFVLLLAGSGIWFFKAGTADNAVGAGGLPLIKADTNPAKLPPEDPGGEIMPNADSTVFSAMGIGNETDPSMEGIKLPEAQSAESPADTGEFAGLRTGFAVPAEPETKTESLFLQPSYKDTGESKYFSGLVDAPVEPAVPPVEDAVTVEDAPEEIKTDPVKVATDTAQEKIVEKKAAPVAAEVKPAEPKAEEKKVEIKKPDITPTSDLPQPTPIAAAPELPATDPTAMAQSMEAAEKSAIRPAAKPQPPVEEKPATVEAAPVKEEPKAVEAKEIKEIKATAPKPEDAPYKPATSPSTGAKGYYIQLASSPAGADMMGVWNKMKARYAVALAGLSPTTQTANVMGKGEFVRLQAGPMTQSEANDRCKAVRQVDAKAGCFVLKR